MRPSSPKTSSGPIDRSRRGSPVPRPSGPPRTARLDDVEPVGRVALADHDRPGLDRQRLEPLRRDLERRRRDAGEDRAAGRRAAGWPSPRRRRAGSAVPTRTSVRKDVARIATPPTPKTIWRADARDQDGHRGMTRRRTSGCDRLHPARASGRGSRRGPRAGRPSSRRPRRSACRPPRSATASIAIGSISVSSEHDEATRRGPPRR